MYVNLNYEKMNIIIYFFQIFFIAIFSFYTALKILNSQINKKLVINVIFASIPIALICSYIDYVSNFMYSIISLVLLIGLIFTLLKKYNFSYSLIIIAISVSINYILLFFSIVIMFLPSLILKIKNDYLIFIFMIIIHFVFLYVFTKVKKIRNGFIFLQEKIKNKYLEISILNISVIILFTVIFFIIYIKIPAREVGIGFLLIAILMYATIKQSFQTYYKQKLLIKELEETKKELQEKKEEIEKLEKENLEISKTSHSISHKQKSLEHKINEILKKQETAEELDIKDRINNISKQLSEKQTIIELTKTNIQEIDDMLNYMQSECTKNKIDFQLQTNGNILSMTNNIISKEELEILLADHIKDAIIAIKYSDNSYKNILVRLGKIDGVYSIYIYDTGIEFETNTLKNLGKKPITTHKNDGGTGMGFINTFETLKKHKASLIIKEIGKPSKDDYTKIIIIKFDNKNNFIIDTYR